MSIEELKQALEAATPGPWAFNFEKHDDYTTIRAGEFEVADAWFCPEMPANARLIVEAVNNLPKLLKLAEAAREVLAWDSDCIREELFDGPCYGQDNWKANFDALRKALEELNND